MQDQGAMGLHGLNVLVQLLHGLTDWAQSDDPACEKGACH